MAKIHIIGAGPAGSISAISALRCGHDVSISEEHAVSGLPENCSGLLSGEGLRSLKPFLDFKRHVIRPMHGADIHLGSQTLSVRRKEAVGFVCDRSAIDMALAARAQDMGAAMHYGERVVRDFRSDNIIGADGPHSSVARHFGFPKIGRYAATLQALLPHRSENPDIVEVFLSRSMFPGFFGWVIPHDECTAEFGVGVSLPNRPLEAWKRLLKLKGKKGAARPRGAAIPISPRSKTGMRKGGMNIILAGDAAGQVKATTGGGVIFGGNCAALAGRFATEPLRYELEWRARFGADLSLHNIIHGYLSGLSDEGLTVLGRRLNKLNFDVYLSEHGHMDRPTKMLRPELIGHMLRAAAGIA